jgi:hypothetical protein
MIRRLLAQPETRKAGMAGVILLAAGLAACGGGTQTSSGGGGGGGGGGSTVAPFFFGMHINNPNSPFPSTANVPVAGVRLWDTQTSWSTTNTSPGVYDWSSLDFRVNQALSNKVDVLYDFARTPTWAQCANNNPLCGSADTSIICAYATIPAEGGPGECFPPADLNVDGSGSNQHWIDWVTAVVTRYKGKISYYEIWNEPNNTAMWQGTDAQLVRLAGDVRCIIVGDKGCNPQSSYAQKGIDPSAKVLTPGFGNPIDRIVTYLATPLNGGTGTGISFADIAAFHGYPGQSPPEQVLKIFNTLSTPLQGTKMPVFDTEGSWGSNGSIPSISDPDQQAAFTARYLLVQQSAGIARLYWYGWDYIKSDNGDLWTPSGLTLAGVAYQQTEIWMSGATLSTPCSASGSVWTCSYTRPGGYQALVVWDQSQTCRNGSCTTSSFSLPSSPQFVQYQDLARNVHSVTGSVAIGAKPILLETGNIP